MNGTDPVIVYTTPSCFYCKIAREFLRRNNISVIERDVEANPSFLAELQAKSHQRGVPVFEIGDEIFVGFDRPAIAKALGIRE